MTRVFVLAALFLWPAVGANSFLHKFSLWGGSNAASKLDLYIGFTNGLVVGAGVPLRNDNTASRQLLVCLSNESTRPGTSQAIAMIDKYYRDNPEKWNIPLGQGLIEALMVKGSPAQEMVRLSGKRDQNDSRSYLGCD
jgi:hypothetical protein